MMVGNLTAFSQTMKAEVIHSLKILLTLAAVEGG